MKPRAVTGDLYWGVSVPFEQAAGKVLNVWFDTPNGYISVTQEWATAQNQDWKVFFLARSLAGELRII